MAHLLYLSLKKQAAVVGWIGPQNQITDRNWSKQFKGKRRKNNIDW